MGRVHRTKGGENVIRVVELFSGIGSQTQALKNLGITHKVVATSEIDKYAVQSYNALHGDTLNLGDITKLHELPQSDLWTYSFPCTDISVAGKLGGLEKGSGTRSGLLWEVERLLLRASEKGNLPKYLLLENVKNLVGKKFKADYDEWLAFLSGLGYSNYWQVLNAKHYGIPQNRERVFCVSILGAHTPYEFPKPFSLELRLRDMLETNVDEKYFISSQRALNMLSSHYQQRKNSILPDSGTAPTICSRDWKEPKCVVLGSLADEKYSKMIESSRRVHGIDGIAPTVHTCSGGNTEPKIAFKERFHRQALERLGKNEYKHGDTIDSLNEKLNTSGVCPTVTTRPEGFNTAIIPVVEEPRIMYEEPLKRKGWHNKACEVLNPNGICTCIHTQSNNLLQKITEPQIIQRCGDRDKKRYCISENAYTIPANPMSDRYQMVVEPKICAMRGRNPLKPSLRVAGVPTEQRLEFNGNGTTNTITTVQKDNLVVCEERKDEGIRLFKDGCSGALRTIDSCGDKRVIEVGGLYTDDSPRFHRPPLTEISRTLKAGLHDAGVQIQDGTVIRIRKLTPTECLRLMGWKDTQIDKIRQAKISSTQMYRQAGNGIVVQVLEYIFANLFDKIGD